MADALRKVKSGGPMEQTAKPTETVAKNTDKLVAAMRSGRLVFT